MTGGAVIVEGRPEGETREEPVDGVSEGAAGTDGVALGNSWGAPVGVPADGVAVGRPVELPDGSPVLLGVLVLVGLPLLVGEPVLLGLPLLVGELLDDEVLPLEGDPVLLGNDGAGAVGGNGVDAAVGK